MSSSRKAVGLSVELTGALGKRTKYQTEETAQLLLSVTSASDGGGEQGFIQDILLGGFPSRVSYRIFLLGGGGGVFSHASTKRSVNVRGVWGHPPRKMF